MLLPLGSFILSIACLYANGMRASDNANFWLLLTLILLSINNTYKGDTHE